MTSGSLQFTVLRAVNPATDAQRESMLREPGFGKYHTDHMVSIDYAEGRGWHNARVIPYGPIELDPSAIVLHYAQEVFEGLKAYRWADGSIVSFRADANAARLRSSRGGWRFPNCRRGVHRIPAPANRCRQSLGARCRR